jgi:hypothetical protein
MKQFIEWQVFGFVQPSETVWESPHPYTHLVYLYLFYYDGFSADRLFYSGFLDEYQTLYHSGQTESVKGLKLKAQGRRHFIN